jgi:hypothetical protein
LTSVSSGIREESKEAYRYGVLSPVVLNCISGSTAFMPIKPYKEAIGCTVRQCHAAKRTEAEAWHYDILVDIGVS